MILNLCAVSICFAADGSDDLFYWPCYDLEIIFARGSGGRLYETNEFKTLVESAQKITNSHGLSVMVHDLDYPAIDVETPAHLIGAFVSAGKAFEFGDSVKDGVAKLKEHYRVQSVNCPDMDFAFVGYSQGAMVVSQSADYFDSKRVKFIMLAGDPNTYLPEGEGLFPAACDGGALSPWRTYAPNCRTYEGVFGARKPYELSALTGKYSLWCNREDYICGSSKNPLKNSGHVTYAESAFSWGVTRLAQMYLEANVGNDTRPVFRSMRSNSIMYDESLIDDGRFGAEIEAPENISVWRDGDKLRLYWTQSAGKYLLIKFNGFDLGYIDADLGEFEIRDVDFNSDYSLSLAWMDSTGELGNFIERKSEDVSDEAPVIEVQNSETIEDILKPEFPKISTMNVVNSASNFGAAAVQNVSENMADNIDHSGVVLRPKSSGSSLSFANKSEIVGIILSMIGAGGLLIIFVIQKRRG